jgi:hypothetical protein
MMKTARVLAFALMLFGSMSFVQHGSAAYAQSQTIVVTDGMIARLKAALHLSPAQEIHWQRLEATLRDTVQQRHVADATGSTGASAGFVQRVRTRMRSVVLDAWAARRVAVAARPLIATLDDNQKRVGEATLRDMGVASLF